jgi:erythromycin esterase-like protein
MRTDNSQMEVMDVSPSRDDSYERVMHDTGISRFMLDLREGMIESDVRKALMEKRLERFIGVIYRPVTERWSHYSNAILPKQFDCYVWFDETQAVHAFETAQPDEPPSIGESYPYGL